jgi:hypothetical protein
MGKIVKFTAIPSGDFECFTFAVTPEEYTRITGKVPNENDKNQFNEGLYDLYPNNIFGDSNGVLGITIEWMEVE